MPGPHHFGYWVPDLAAAVERAARTLSIGPFLVHRHVAFDTFRMADGTEITDPAFFDHTAAFAAWGPIVLELAEVHSIDERLASAYGIGFDRIGHVSWVTEDLEAEGSRLEAAGCKPIHRAATGAVQVAWYSGGTLFPHPIELHRAGAPILGMPARLAAAARNWDGRDLMLDLVADPDSKNSFTTESGEHRRDPTAARADRRRRPVRPRGRPGTGEERAHRPGLRAGP